jgi:lipoprotein-anchoring transpeptidase ErfK/SrfK
VEVARTNPPPMPVSTNGLRPVENILEAQIALARQAISSGSIDGLMGSQTHSALETFQKRQHLPLTGTLDAATRQRLLIAEPVLNTVTVTSNDLQRLVTIPSTWVGKSELPHLDYETILELLGERSFSTPKLIRDLNPAINWNRVTPGTRVQLPNVEYPSPENVAAFIRISLGNRALEAFDSDTNLLAHFPCSIGKIAEKRPVGLLRIDVIIPRPNYTFNPDIFPESEEARTLGRKLVLPTGPNNPVGTAWMGLSRPGYGIHGTPAPEQVGRTESHGCFRLANWNAEYLMQLAWVGMPVLVEP